MDEIRDDKGRFKPGTSGNAGRSNKGTGRKTNALKQRLAGIMESACSDDDLKLIFEIAVKRAQSGDSTAREFVFDRMFGKAISELDREIIRAIQLQRGEPLDAET